jgi:hypothetical protein
MASNMSARLGFGRQNSCPLVALETGRCWAEGSVAKGLLCDSHLGHSIAMPRTWLTVNRKVVMQKHVTLAIHRLHWLNTIALERLCYNPNRKQFQQAANCRSTRNPRFCSLPELLPYALPLPFIFCSAFARACLQISHLLQREQGELNISLLTSASNHY